jgi:hypothetical protein
MPAPDMSGALSLILPMAGRDGCDAFRGLETAQGETLIHRAMRSFTPFLDRIAKVYCVVLREQEAQFDVTRRLADELSDVAFEVVVLDAPTTGPAETVAVAIAQAGITGRTIVCDIDHRLDVAPLFEAMDDADTIVSLWPLAGEDLKRWSVACLGGNGQIMAVADRRLPGAAGFFHGVIGCYFFRDAGAVARACRDAGFARFSQYFNHLAEAGNRAHGVRLDAAEFFGDAERIRALENGEPQGTIFCDIDGTLIRHEDKPDYSRLPEVLPGSREKLQAWIDQGYHVVLCTARKAQDEAKLAQALRDLAIPHHRLITGLSSGTRIVINDRKPHAIFTAQAGSLEIARDAGIAALDLGARRKPSVLRRFEGGSFAETLLLEEGGKPFVRKRVAKDGNLAVGYHRLRDQFRTLERFALMDAALVPALHGEENNSHEYFYDMEFVSGYAPLSECAPTAQAAGMEQLLDRFDAHLYCRRSKNPGVAEDWLLRHFEAKITPKIASLRSNARLAPLLVGEGAAIDGVWHPSLEKLLADLRESGALAHFVPQFLSLVHGDLTFQNILLSPEGDLKVIDMEAQDGLEAVELDMGKIFQSTHSGYDHWSRLSVNLCEQSADGVRLLHAPAAPDEIVFAPVRRRWSHILGCSEEAVEMKGGFYLGLHLARMVPFRLRQSEDQAVYALANALVHLNHAAVQARGRHTRRVAA